MRHFICLCLLVLWATLGCGKRDAQDANVGVTQSALTTIDTRPESSRVPSFGQNGLQTVGQVVTVPATDTILESFTFFMDLPATVVFRGEVYAWDGAKATGAALHESAARSTAGTGYSAALFETGGLSLTAGGAYVLFVTSLKDAGSGFGTFGIRSDNPYPGGTQVVHFLSTSPAVWTTSAWTAFSAQDLAFTATFASAGPVASTTALVSSVNPSVFGQAVTFTATVTGAAGARSGTVTFRNGDTLLGSATLNGAGQASFSTSALAVGTHPITAEYGGSAAYLASTSSALSQVVGQASTTTSVASSLNPSTVGVGVTFTATVSPVTPGAGIPAGTVNFREGDTILGSGTLNASGVATFSTSALSVGSHAITAQYVGNASFATSTSSAVTQIVSQAGTSVALTSSENPTTFGSSITFTATLKAPAGSGVPTGTVTFRAGSSTLGTVPLDEGVAAFTTAELAGGTHTITAQYTGDANHSAASGSLSQVVNRATPSAAVVSSTNPSVFGQTVTFTANVKGSGGTPTGTVTFRNGATTLGTGTLNSAGQASLSISTLTAGTHAVTVSYSGDSNFATVTSSALSQQVGKAGTTTELSSSSNPGIVSTNVTFTATVSAVAPGAGVPAGSVRFRNGATVLGTTTLNASGVATLSTDDLTVGTHEISAEYVGNTNFATSTSTTLSQVMSRAGVTVSLASSPNPSAFGNTATFTASVSAVGGGGTPTGNITFREGSTTLGTSALQAGKATLATAALGAGTHAIIAEYGGDDNHAGGSTGSVTHVVSVAETSTTLVSSANPTVFGGPITLTASVASKASGSLTGHVTFMSGETVLGSEVVDAARTATLETRTLPVGTHSLTAVYSGDDNYAASTSAPVSQVINKAGTTVVLSSSSNPSLVGASVSLVATVTATPPGSGTASGTVTFNRGETTLGTATLDDSGIATFATNTLSVGAHSITARYEGDGNFAASTSSELIQNVAASAAILSLASTPNPSTFGEAVTFTVAISGDNGIPSGTYLVRDDERTLSTDTLSAGAATFTISDLKAGTHSLTLEYSGDTNYASGDGSATHVVEQAATTTTLTSSLNPALAGETVTFTATIASAAAGFSGEVEFFDGTVSLGVSPLSGTSATFFSSALGEGNHAISAMYKGDANFSSSSSTVLTQIINPVSGSNGTGGTGAVGAGGGAGASALTPPGNVEGGGSCGCRMQHPRNGGAVLAALAGLVVLGLRRRRASCLTKH